VSLAPGADERLLHGILDLVVVLQDKSRFTPAFCP
jgi:hypothetical protein